MINIAVIDDNKEFLQEFIPCLYKYSDCAVSVKEFSQGEEFIQAVKAGSIFHILFADIILNKENGIQVAAQIKELLPDINIVFISSEKSFFMDVYDVEHTYFLTKPVDGERLKKVLSICLSNIRSGSVPIRFGNKTAVLELNKIMFAEGYGKKIIIHYADGTQKEIHTPLKSFDEPLKNTSFLRTHQSYIVNLKFMINYSRNKLIILSGGNEIPISRKYENAVDDSITRFLGNI